VKGRERRAQPRLRLDNQDATISARIVWPNERDLTIEEILFIDISRSGFGLQSQQEFSVGELLKFEVSVKGEAPLQLVAVICNCRGKGNHFRYGAYFEYDAEPGDEYAESVLAQLEQEITQKVNLEGEAQSRV
jgi:PilZ domain